MKVCDECHLPFYARGKCRKHWANLRYSESPELRATHAAAVQKYERSDKCKKARAKAAAARYQRDKKLGLVTDRSYFIAIKIKYGITKQQYLQMLQAQNGLCAICGIAPKQRLFIDHCHATGAVRGLLCVGCNSVIGHARDSVDVLQSAIRYLSSSK